MQSASPRCSSAYKQSSSPFTRLLSTTFTSEWTMKVKEWNAISLEFACLFKSFDDGRGNRIKRFSRFFVWWAFKSFHNHNGFHYIAIIIPSIISDVSINQFSFSLVWIIDENINSFTDRRLFSRRKRKRDTSDCLMIHLTWMWSPWAHRGWFNTSNRGRLTVARACGFDDKSITYCAGTVVERFSSQN